MSTRVMKKFESVADGIDNMVAAAKYDYTLSNNNEQMNEEFANSFIDSKGYDPMYGDAAENSLNKLMKTPLFLKYTGTDKCPMAIFVLRELMYVLE